jgi:ribonuclease P protein component
MATAQVQSRRPCAARLVTLKRRSDFLRVRQGARFSTPAFVLEAKPRMTVVPQASAEARFGFTVSKRVGNAVERNRIRRRLKAAVRDVADAHAKGDFDYVLIARRKALDARFQLLVSDLAKALGRVHVMPRQGRPGRAERDAKPAS